MVKKTLLFNKLIRFKKGSLNKGQFFSDQHLLKNQISFEDLENQNKQSQTEADKLGEVNQEVSTQNTKRKKITNLLMFIFNIVVVAVILIYQLTHSEVESFSNILTSGLFRWEYLLLLLATFFATMVIDMFRTAQLLKQSTKKWQFSLCYKTCALGKYWDSITPLSSGGEPFQIYYLNKHSVKAGTSISVTMARYIIFQLSWMLISICATIYGSKVYGETNLVSVASFVGFAFNTILLVGTWILSVSKKIGKILVAKVLKLLKKMHIIKNYEKQYDKVMNTVNNFQSTMVTYTKNIFPFIGMVLSQIIQLLLQNSMPYLIFLMLGGTPDVSVWIGMMMLTVLIDLASSFIPLPGGTGMSEVSFTIIYNNIFPAGTVFWAMLMWRFMTYYIYIIQGVIITIYDYVWGDKKFEWQKRKWELEAESNKFKQNQVKKYNKRTKGRIKL